MATAQKQAEAARHQYRWHVGRATTAEAADAALRRYVAVLHELGLKGA